MLPDLLHVLCGADCQLLNSLFQMFAADAESAERSRFRKSHVTGGDRSHDLRPP